MKDRILNLVTTKPKNYSTIIKNNTELLSWVMANSKIESTILAEHIYSAVYGVGNICSRGKLKKFVSFSQGFGGCSRVDKCQCLREQVSNSVKDSKKLVTIEQQAITNKIRSETNLAKYGVECVAQLPENVQKFRDWYADPDNVNSMLNRIQQTNLAKYGVVNCKSLPEVEQKIIATCLARYGVTNVAQIPSTKAKLRARTAEYKLTGHLIKCGYDRFCEYVEKNHSFRVITTIDNYPGTESSVPMLFACIVCGNEKLTRFHYNRGINCDNCNPRRPSYTSNEEQEVFDYITKELGILNGIQSDKSIINPYELDMVFPDQSIAIEYSGLYWHSELSSGKDKNYHYDKMIRANSKGYRLITIFSDEWNNNRDIVKSKLRNVFGKTTVVHYARKLQTQLVPAEQSKQFLDRYHLQGNSSAKINLGLYDGTNLVALMTFSNGRAALNTKVVTDEYELVRFVTNGSSIVGGASKLLKNFIRLYNPKTITSYADNRWSEGNVYTVLGFTKVSKPTIGYWYVDDYTSRMHRYNFTKATLVKEGNDASKTEWQIMQGLGYDRIWDCGHQKFVMNICDTCLKV